MTTQYKPYAAFGAAFIQCTETVGETREVKLGDDGFVNSGYYFYTHGEVECIVKETGEKLENRKAGWLNTENKHNGASTTGTLLVKPITDAEWFCVSYANNSKFLPNLQSVILKPTEKKVLPVGTDFFLARGEVVANAFRTFIGPCQIRVRTSDVTLVNNTQETVYGLIVTAPM
jgi:hypothetical protein